jgi:N-acylneuraminate cytidylyltransferase
MTSAIAIIPARGGSKRLPRKNVLPLRGRPIIAYTIDAALGSGVFERVIVSTEDAEIGAAARAAGAEVMGRAMDLAGDRARIVDVCQDVLARVAAEGRAPERFCCLLPTAALRDASDIREAMALLEPGRVEFVMGVCEYTKTPLQALARDAEGALHLMWPELANTPRQEQPQLVVDNGSLYWCGTSAFQDFGDFYGPGLRGWPMPRWKSVDIDTEEDWELLDMYAARHLGPR